ncbi:MAG: thermonuclease family protein [Burkholderiales bacterium]|nr:thermonuclease family protein [Burkholderiales bacterium]
MLLFAAGLATAEELRGTVINVADGDTVTVLDSAHVRHKVRLSGIDAPEKHQAFGTRSRQHLTALAQGKDVIVIWNKHDRYGRIIGKVLIAKCANNACPGTLDAGLAQLHTGLAWHYKQYQREQEAGERTSYAAAELAARIKLAGLWQDASPVPPWDYRRRARDLKISATGSRAALLEQPALFQVAPAFMRQRIAQLRPV